MEILYLKKTNSTHLFLEEKLKNEELVPPIAVIADIQTGGIGSRGNKWESLEGNLFLSFCLENSFLPKDLPDVSRSIYFAYLMKEVLEKEGSKIWIKWPNDFYIGNKKIGGVITKMFRNYTLCSMGINLKKAPDNFGKLDIEVDKISLVKKFFIKTQLSHSWKEIFRKFKVEFEKSKEFFFNDGNFKVSMRNAVLNPDGSITINNKRMYNLR